MPERGASVEPYIRVGAKALKNAGRKTARRLPVPAELLNRETLGALIALVLLTNLRLMGELAPFGLAFWVAAARGEHRRRLYYALVMLAAAYAGTGTSYALSLFFSAGIYCLLDRTLRKFQLPPSLFVAAAAAFGSLPALLTRGVSPYDFFLLALETAMTVLALAVFMQVLSRPAARLYPDRHLEGITAWVVFLGLLLLSLSQGGPLPEQVANTAARIIILWAAFWLGPGLAAAAGALLGFLLGVQSLNYIILGIFTLAGFLAGLCRHFGRLAAAAGFMLGSLALTLYAFGWEAISGELAVSGAAAVFCLLAPVLPVRFRALAPFLERKPGDEADRVRDLTAVRIKDYARVFSELAGVLNHLPAGRSRDEPAVSVFVDKLLAHVCKDCPSKRRCWEKDYKRSYNALLRILADLDGGSGVNQARPPDTFWQICRRREDFIKTVAFLHDMESLREKYMRQVRESHRLVNMQLLGLSQVMTELAQEVRQGVPEPDNNIKNRCFHVEIGIAQTAKNNEEVCGDYYSYLELRDGKQAFILSDGMGAGSKAQRESRSTVDLVERLLLAGFRHEAIVRTVNTILQLRSHEESFATLDILIVDTEKGEMECLKIGAAPSFMHLRGKVSEIRSPTVPLGILNDVELKPVTMALGDDTMLVMVTDGVCDALPSQPDWLKNFLSGQSLSHPQVLADEIIHQARVLSGSTSFRDDVTVLVCRAKRLKHKIRDYITA